MDIVASNFGYNTKYKASIAAPELLFYGDFDADGDKELLEAGFEDGECFPHRGFSCSSGAMPFLKDKLKTFHKSVDSKQEARQCIATALKMRRNI